MNRRAPSCRIVYCTVLCLTAALLGLAVPARCAAPYLTADLYGSRIAAVEAAAESAAAGNPTEGAHAMALLAAIERCPVLAAPGDLVFVDNRALLAQMQAAELVTGASQHRDAWSQIAAQIADMRAHAQSTPDPGADAIARTILSRYEFSSDPLAGKSLWDRFGEWLERELKKIHINNHWPHFDTAPPDFKVSPLLPEALLIGLVVAVLALLVFQIRLWWRRRGAAAAAAGYSDLAFSLHEQALVQAQDHFGLESLASRAAESGDYRSALRLTFLATLVFLNAESIIVLDRSKTNWEYLREARSVGLDETLLPLVGKFDLVWYGERAASWADFEMARETLRAVRDRASALSPAALASATGATRR